MGECFSDVKGGRRAVGVAGGLTDGGASGPNDAVDNFFRARGEHTLCSQIEVGLFWVYATIIDIESIGIWQYLVCSKCHKEISPHNYNFQCQSCYKSEVSGKERFKITIKVKDVNGTTTSFLLWADDCLALIGSSKYHIDEDGNLVHLPQEIDTLTGKRALFKVEVKEGQNNNFSVSEVITDLEMITNHYVAQASNQEYYNNSVVEKRKIEIGEMMSIKDKFAAFSLG